MLAPILATALSLVPPAAAKEKRTRVQSVADREWEKTDRADRLFMMNLTPPFPASWPPSGDGKLSYLAYSGGRRSGLSDGELVGSVWGRVVSDPKARKPSFERISNATKLLGIQGVRPVSAVERAAYDQREKALKAVAELAKAKGTPGKADPAIRAFYCQWEKFDGVIAESLPRSESAFLGWLDCDGKARTTSPDAPAPKGA